MLFEFLSTSAAATVLLTAQCFHSPPLAVGPVDSADSVQTVPAAVDVRVIAVRSADFEELAGSLFLFPSAAVCTAVVAPDRVAEAPAEFVAAARAAEEAPDSLEVVVGSSAVDCDSAVGLVPLFDIRLAVVFGDAEMIVLECSAAAADADRKARIVVDARLIQTCLWSAEKSVAPEMVAVCSEAVETPCIEAVETPGVLIVASNMDSAVVDQSYSCRELLVCLVLRDVFWLMVCLVACDVTW